MGGGKQCCTSTTQDNSQRHQETGYEKAHEAWTVRRDERILVLTTCHRNFLLSEDRV
jgi:hypothetical protein